MKNKGRTSTFLRLRKKKAAPPPFANPDLTLIFLTDKIFFLSKNAMSTSRKRFGVGSRYQNGQYLYLFIFIIIIIILFY